LKVAHLVALHICKEEGVADAQLFAVDLEDPVALAIFNLKVIANGKQLFPQPVLGSRAPPTKDLALFATFVDSISHGCSWVRGA